MKRTGNYPPLLVLVVGIIIGAVILSGAPHEDSEPSSSLTEHRDSENGNPIERIQFQIRHGNVATSKLYNVKLKNSSTYRYSKTMPGPGMLCDTEAPEGDCEVEVEPGYLEVRSEVSGSGYREEVVARESEYLYHPKTERCASNLSDTDIKISGC